MHGEESSKWHWANFALGGLAQMICETIRTFGCAYVERINHAPRKSSTEHNATELYSIILKKNVNKNIQDV